MNVSYTLTQQDIDTIPVFQPGSFPSSLSFCRPGDVIEVPVYVKEAMAPIDRPLHELPATELIARLKALTWMGFDDSAPEPRNNPREVVSALLFHDPDFSYTCALAQASLKSFQNKGFFDTPAKRHDRQSSLIEVIDAGNLLLAQWLWDKKLIALDPSTNTARDRSRSRIPLKTLVSIACLTRSLSMLKWLREHRLFTTSILCAAASGSLAILEWMIDQPHINYDSEHLASLSIPRTPDRRAIFQRLLQEGVPLSVFINRVLDVNYVYSYDILDLEGDLLEVVDTYGPKHFIFEKLLLYAIHNGCYRWIDKWFPDTKPMGIIDLRVTDQAALDWLLENIPWHAHTIERNQRVILFRSSIERLLTSCGLLLGARALDRALQTMLAHATFAEPFFYDLHNIVAIAFARQGTIESLQWLLEHGYLFRKCFLTRVFRECSIDVFVWACKNVPPEEFIDFKESMGEAVCNNDEAIKLACELRVPLDDHVIKGVLQRNSSLALEIVKLPTFYTSVSRSFFPYVLETGSEDILRVICDKINPDERVELLLEAFKTRQKWAIPIILQYNFCTLRATTEMASRGNVSALKEAHALGFPINWDFFMDNVEYHYSKHHVSEWIKANKPKQLESSSSSANNLDGE